MDQIFQTSLANVFSSLLLAILLGLGKYLRDIVVELRSIRTSVSVMQADFGNLKERVVSLESKRHRS